MGLLKITVSSWLLAWLDLSHLTLSHRSNSVFIIWWFRCTLQRRQVSDLQESKQTAGVEPFANKLSLCELSNICTAASRIPFLFFPAQTILIQNIYRNPQNSAQTADGSHCKSTVGEVFKTMVLKSPLNWDKPCWLLSCWHRAVARAGHLIAGGPLAFTVRTWYLAGQQAGRGGRWPGLSRPECLLARGGPTDSERHQPVIGLTSGWTPGNY